MSAIATPAIAGMIRSYVDAILSATRNAFA